MPALPNEPPPSFPQIRLQQWRHRMVVVRAVTCLVLGVRSFAADVLMPNGCAFYNDIKPSAGRSRQTCRNPRGRLWDVLLLELTERIQFSAPDSYPKQRFSDAAE